jgi:hypothetical protein
MAAAPKVVRVAVDPEAADSMAERYCPYGRTLPAEASLHKRASFGNNPPAFMEPQPPISLSRALLIGTGGFTVASLIVYGFWSVAGGTVQGAIGEAGFYAACAVLFGVLGAVLLKPLARISFPRFAMIYGGAFFSYALCWCLAWFLVGGRAGEWLGGFAGSLAFCAVLAAAFRAWPTLVVGTLVLFIGHSGGYFLGGVAHERITVLPQIAWGLFYGLGTGAGIGFAFYKAQRRASEVSPPQTS